MASMLTKMTSQFLYYRPRLEAVLSELDKHRLKLPLLSLERLFCDFSLKPVVFHELPIGPWSTPLVDVAMLLKIALCANAKSVMELGSYRGATALALVHHLEPGSRIITVDSDPRHGDLYRDGPFAPRIERRVASVERATFCNDKPGSIDLLFLDADHRYQAVKHDTEILIDLISNNGYFVWHDYANFGKFSGKNGVPEYLHELNRTLPVAWIAGTHLAIHSPAWKSDSGAAAYRNAIVRDDNVPYADPWTSAMLRG
jgi:hypothetical protein